MVNSNHIEYNNSTRSEVFIRVYMKKTLLTVLFLLLYLPTFFSILAVEKESTYSLPYPGILPDHPLYLLKVARDKIYDYLVSDLVTKAEFRLQTADKRFAMGIMLVEKNKKELAESTVSKASKYYEEAYLTVIKAKGKGRNIIAVKDKMISASYKYEEIISKYISASDGKVKTGYKESLERILRIRAELLKINQNLQN